MHLRIYCVDMHVNVNYLMLILVPDISCVSDVTITSGVETVNEKKKMSN